MAEQHWKVSNFILESWRHTTSIVAAQLDSYNFFLHVTLPLIVAEYGFFECVAEGNQQKHRISVSNVHYRLPEIMEGSGHIFPLSPFTCLQRKLDYMSNILVDITHRVESNDGKTFHENVFREHNLFDLPVMTFSSACRLSENPEFVAEESLSEFGGLFIVAGSEKVLLAQEKLRVNYPFVTRQKKASRYVWMAEVRSWTEEKMRSTSTSYFYLHEKKGHYEMKVKMPFLEKFEIPLLLVLRLLEIPNPVDIIPGDPAIEALVREILTDHSGNGYATMSMEEIYEFIAKRGIKDLSKLKTPEKRQKYVSHIILNEFLPHEPDKAYGLGLIIWELLMTVQGKFQAGDRDAFYNKRLHCAGVLMALQLRILLRQYMKNVQLSLQKNIDAGRYIDIIDIMSPKKVTSGLKYALATGRWGVPKGANKGGQDGTAQVFTRYNFEASVSHSRRVNTPLNRESKQAKPRQVRSSHYGLLCAVETTEGASCGLVESLTTLCHVRLGGTAQTVDLIIRRFLAAILLPMSEYRPALTPLFLFNGTLFGVLAGENQVPEVLRSLRNLRRQQDLPFDTSICWDPSRRQLRVNTDVGAALRPLLVFENLSKLPALASVYQYDPSFFSVLLAEGVLEYLDKEEEELNAVIALDWRSVSPLTTHMDIHPTMIFGLAAGCIPFPDHNQAPRNIFGTIQSKQSAGLSVTNFYHRFDTAMHIMDHVERPLVTTMISSLFGNDENPSGMNVVLAIMSASYNQEDSNIMNKSFIDMGGMNSTVYHTYTGEERLSTNDKEVFGKPEPPEVANIQKGDYSYLNELGFAPPGSRFPAQQGTAIIGKIMTSLSAAAAANQEESSRPRDRSLLLFPIDDNVRVDRVLRTVGSEGNVMLKIRTRDWRQPEVGDKFAATCGQKNTVGRVVAPEDMPFAEKTGITPDMIINPHWQKFCACSLYTFY